MKKRVRNAQNWIPVGLCLWCCLLAVPVRAANLYWDRNGTTTGSGVANGGNYTWETSSWSTSSAGTVATAAWTEGSFPEFAAGSDGTAASYTVNAGSPHTIAGMLERTSSGTVTISGSVLTIANGTSGGGGVGQGFLFGPGNITINNVIAGTGGMIPQCNSGCGNLTLNGNNTFSGGFNMGGGNIIFIGNPNALGTGPIYFNGATYGTFGNDGVMDFLGDYTIANDVKMGSGLYSTGVAIQQQFIFDDTSAHSMIFSGNWTTGTSTPVYLQFGNQGANQTFTISGKISGSTGFTNYGTGTLILSGANTFTGTLVLSGSGTVIKIGGAGTVASGLNIINKGSFVYNSSSAQTISGIISSTGTLTQSGSGTLTLTGANTYSGSTTISAGQITLNGTSTLGNGTGTLHLSGGRLATSANRTPSSAPVANALDLTADSIIMTTSTANPAELNLSSSTIGGSAGTLIFSNGNNSASGLFNPRFSGGNFTFGRPITIANGSAGSPTVLNSYNATGTDQTFTDVISGNGSFVRNASTAGTGGRTIFTGANTYSGGTTVNRGTLQVDNASGSGTGSGPVTVNADGTLAGTGLIAGAVAVVGELAPGDAGIGTLNFGSSLALSGTTTMEISKAAGLADQVVMSGGTATLGGTLAVVNQAGTLALGDTFNLFEGTLAGAFSGFDLPVLPAGLKWDTSQLSVGGDGTLKVVCDGSLGASAGTNQAICSGTGTVIGGSPTATGGSGSGYTYSWSPATGLDNATVANPTASPTSTTTYTVTVTDPAGCTAVSSVTVSVDLAPVLSSQPAAQTGCSGSTASFSVSASGPGGLTYSWARHNNGGWGSAWLTSGGGSTFRASSTDNDFGDAACASLNAAYDINSPSGNALGMWGGFSGDEAAIRSFAPLAPGQVVSMDFDNGNVDSGSKVGFSLQTSGGADVLQFYFLGGQGNYKYNDGTEQDSGVAFQRTGLRVQFELTSPTSYKLILTPCGGTAASFTGSYSGTIAQLKLFNQNNTGGSDKNVYFNNLLLGGYVDNADNYSGDFAGQDKGDQPLALGNGGSTYITPTLTDADNGSQYEVVVSGCGGAVLSAAATLTVNPAPTADAGPSQAVCSSRPTAMLAGTVGGGATGGTWSGGTGSFVPDANTLDAQYTPSAAEIAAGSVTLTLTSTGELAPCGPATSQMTITITAGDSTPPSLSAGTVAACYTTQADAEAAAKAATTVSDNCDPNPVLTASTVGSCDATITVTATDASGNHASVEYTTHIVSPPVFGPITATEASANVKDCASTTVQGRVLISVPVSQSCGLTGGRPSISLVSGSATETPVFDNESPAGTFNYHWDVTSLTSNGTWTATITAADTCQSVSSQFLLCMTSAQISGQVQLEGFAGTGTVPLHSRLVTFVATDGPGSGATVLKTWNLALTNESGDTFTYTLNDAPRGLRGLSAVTAWNLRSKLPVNLDANGQADGVNFTGAKLLRGGDLDGNNAATSEDYTLLGSDFFSFNPVPDITGDGRVDFDDYAIFATNWLLLGDPE